MKYYIIAGEASGDLHASNLVHELKKLDEQAVCKGVGGNLMQQANVDLLFGLDRLAFMGFYEVLKNLPTIRKNFKQVKQAISTFQPDVVILIDYPGFNLRMAKWCKKQGYKVAYYISPQIWAWKENRVEIIKKYVDLMMCILPFEVSFYNKHNYNNAYFVGHPLLDLYNNTELNDFSNKQSIALLPGSRKQELQKLTPIFIQVANQFPNEQFIITAISRLKELYPTQLPSNVKIVFDDMQNVLRHAKVAVVCSGTATLETALLQVPQVVIYKTSWLNYQIGKRLAKVDFISLPNLIANEKIVEELIQHNCSVDNISTQLNKLLSSNNNQFYNKLISKIGERGASVHAAKHIVELVNA